MSESKVREIVDGFWNMPLQVLCGSPDQIIAALTNNVHLAVDAARAEAMAQVLEIVDKWWHAFQDTDDKLLELRTLNTVIEMQRNNGFGMELSTLLSLIERRIADLQRELAGLAGIHKLRGGVK